MSRIKKYIPSYLSLPQIGRISKGEKREGGGKPMEDLDYFLIHLNPEFEYLRPLIVEIYGEKPTEFRRIHLVGKKPDDVFSSRREHWGGGDRLKIACDAETITRRTDDNGIVDFTHVPCYFKQRGFCTTEWNKKKQADEEVNCATVGRMSIILWDLFLKTGIWGAFKVATRSANDVDLLTSTIDNTLSRISRMYDVPIEEIPLKFGRAPRKIFRKDKSGKQMPSEANLFYMEVLLGEMLQPQDPQLDRGADTPLIEAETGEVELSLENFKSTVVQLNLTLPAERFSEECKNIGYSSKEEMIETLAKKCKVTIDFKKDPHANVLALGYLCAAKGIQNPYQVALNTVYAEFSEIPW